MLMTLISYFVVVIAVLLLGSLSVFIVTIPLSFLKKVIRGQSSVLFLSGAVEGLVSIWIGVKVLNFFNKDVGIILIIIILIIFIAKYIKSKPVGILKEIRDSLGEDASDMDTPILVGNIVGLIISCILFIY
jgi:hypothetical protein